MPSHPVAHAAPAPAAPVASAPKHEGRAAARHEGRAVTRHEGRDVAAPVAAGTADAAAPAHGTGAWRFRNRRLFVWKTALLLVTTLALIPILLYKSTMGARLYVGYLVVIHVVGLATFAYGVRRHDLAPTRRGLYGRLAGLAFALLLLALAEKGLRTEFGSQLFWWSLFGIWAIHTFGLALLHLRSPGEAKACPFG